MHGRWGGAPAAPCPIYSLSPPGDLPSPGDLPLPRDTPPRVGAGRGWHRKGTLCQQRVGSVGPPGGAPHPGCAFQKGVPGGGRVGNPQAGTGKGLTPGWGWECAPSPDNATFGGPPAPRTQNVHQVHPGRVSPRGWQHPKAPPAATDGPRGCGLGGTAQRPCPCVRPAAPQGSPSQGAAGPGSSLGRGHGERPPPACGTKQPERRAPPHASRGHPQTPSGGTQGVPVPPSPIQHLSP